MQNVELPPLIRVKQEIEQESCTSLITADFVGKIHKKILQNNEGNLCKNHNTSTIPHNKKD